MSSYSVLSGADVLAEARAAERCADSMLAPDRSVELFARVVRAAAQSEPRRLELRGIVYLSLERLHAAGGVQ